MMSSPSRDCSWTTLICCAVMMLISDCYCVSVVVDSDFRTTKTLSSTLGRRRHVTKTLLSCQGPSTTWMSAAILSYYGIEQWHYYTYYVTVISHCVTTISIMSFTAFGTGTSYAVNGQGKLHSEIKLYFCKKRTKFESKTRLDGTLHFNFFRLTPKQKSEDDLNS